MEAVGQFLPIVLVGVLMYAVLIRPQQRRTKEHNALLASLEVGDEVLTNSGIYGFINAIDDDIIWMEAAEGVEFKISRASVGNKVVLKDQGVEDDSDEDS